MNPISLCIPRVDVSYKRETIKKIFENCLLGQIKKIDVVPNHKEKAKYNRVFVHFADMTCEQQCERLKNGGSIKIVYQEPWFWKCTLSRHANV